MTSRTLLAPARLAGQSVLRSQSDERLVDLASAGSTPAYEAIVARYRGPLQGYCVRILGEERAEDVVQQTFIKAHAALARGEAVLRLRPWLYRIAHNAALNALRERTHVGEDLEDQLEGGEPPELAAERRQGLREVLTAVQALPPRQRDAIVLRALEGRSYEEIARELSVTKGAVRQLLNRARSTLRARVTALTPAGPLLRLAPPLTDAPEGALAAKVCATALLAGALAGGAATLPDEDRAGSPERGGTSARAAPRATAEAAPADPEPTVSRAAAATTGASTDPAATGRGSELRISPAVVRTTDPAERPERHREAPASGEEPTPDPAPQPQPPGRDLADPMQGESHTDPQRSVSFSRQPCPEGDSADQTETPKEGI
jgi:RNA polymerase sigma factor (sigma-70 family)